MFELRDQEASLIIVSEICQMQTHRTRKPALAQAKWKKLKIKKPKLYPFKLTLGGFQRGTNLVKLTCVSFENVDVLGVSTIMKQINVNLEPRV